MLSAIRSGCTREVLGLECRFTVEILLVAEFKRIVLIISGSTNNTITDTKMDTFTTFTVLFLFVMGSQAQNSK